ncbi:MAG: HAD-IA family hydrolase [Proteobacteria bacterium]|nr:HAD-IA family hydrolase [Pseudomonadota bacterium]
MGIRLVLFDLDGTLVDTQRDIVAQARRALALEGYGDFDGEAVARLIGRGSQHLFRTLLGSGTPERRLDAVMERFRSLYAAHLADTSAPYPGIEDALASLASVRKAIVTNKSQVFSDALLKRLGLARHFEAVFGFEAFKKQKPDPEPVREACRRLGAAPHETAMVGDSRFDVEAGRAAGVVTVAALWGYETPAALKGLSPDLTAATPLELAVLLAPGARTPAPRPIRSSP